MRFGFVNGVTGTNGQARVTIHARFDDFDCHEKTSIGYSVDNAIKNSKGYAISQSIESIKVCIIDFIVLLKKRQMINNHALNGLIYF